LATILKWHYNGYRISRFRSKNRQLIERTIEELNKEYKALLVGSPKKAQNIQLAGIAELLKQVHINFK
jgi:hypothetical protein